MPVVKGSHSSWKAKLIDKQVITAHRLMRKRGWSAQKAADQYGVARTTMLSIRSGQSWSWLTGEGI